VNLPEAKLVPDAFPDVEVNLELTSKAIRSPVMADPPND